MASAEPPAHISMNVSLPSGRTAKLLEARRVAEMIDALPDAMFDGTLSPLVQQACLESFFVHVRGLIEFLGVRKADPRDFSATDILPAWTPTIDQAVTDRLLGYWQTASSQLMHFSRSRVKDDAGAAVSVDVSREALQAIADDVIVVWDQFAGKLGNNLAPQRINFSLFKSKG